MPLSGFAFTLSSGSEQTFGGIKYKVLSVYNTEDATHVNTVSAQKNSFTETSILIPAEVSFNVEGTDDAGKAIKKTATFKVVEIVDFSGLNNVTSLTIGDEGKTYVQTIDAEAFKGCSKLADVTFLPYTALVANLPQDFGNNIFEGTAVKKLDLTPTKLASVNAYFNTTKTNATLTEVNFPASLTNIVSNAFINCSKLATVTFEVASKPQTFGAGCFKGTAIATLDLSNTKLTTVNNLFGTTFGYDAITFDTKAKVDAWNAVLPGAVKAGANQIYTEDLAIIHNSKAAGLVTGAVAAGDAVPANFEAKVGHKPIVNVEINGTGGLNVVGVYMYTTGKKSHAKAGDPVPADWNDFVGRAVKTSGDDKEADGTGTLTQWGADAYNATLDDALTPYVSSLPPFTEYKDYNDGDGKLTVYGAAAYNAVAGPVEAGDAVPGDFDTKVGHAAKNNGYADGSTVEGGKLTEQGAKAYNLAVAVINEVAEGDAFDNDVFTAIYGAAGVEGTDYSAGNYTAVGAAKFNDKLGKIATVAKGSDIPTNFVPLVGAVTVNEANGTGKINEAGANKYNASLIGAKKAGDPVGDFADASRVNRDPLSYEKDGSGELTAAGASAYATAVDAKVVAGYIVTSDDFLAVTGEALVADYKDGTGLLTEAGAITYNYTLDGAVKAGDPTGVVFNEDEAATFNASLPGAVVLDQNYPAVQANPNTTLTSVILPGSITDFVNPTMRTAGAFENCTKLASVTFKSNSNKVSLGKKTFLGCPLNTTGLDLTPLSKLETIPSTIVVDNFNGIYAVCDINSTMTTVKFGAGLIMIEENAFNNCTALTTAGVDFSKASNLTSIGDYAFGTTPLLTTLDFTNCAKFVNIATTPFIPGKNKKNTELTKIVLNANTTNIGTALANLPVLNDVNFKDTKLASLVANSLLNADAITSLELPATCEVIEATGNTTGLTSLEIKAANLKMAAGSFTMAATSTIKFGNISKPSAEKIAAGYGIAANAITLPEGGVVSKLTLGEIAWGLNAVGAIAAGTDATITEVEVGKIKTTNVNIEKFGQAKKITFKGNIEIALTAPTAANAVLEELDFGSAEIGVGYIPAAAFQSAKLTQVTWIPNDDKAVAAFDKAAFAAAPVGAANATIYLNTTQKVADECYDRDENKLYNVIFDAILEAITVDVANNGTGSFYYGKYYQKAPYKIAKQAEDGATVVVYGAYVDASDKTIYMEQLHIIEGHYWIPANTPVIVKSTSDAPVKAEAGNAAINSMNQQFGGGNVSQIQYQATPKAATTMLAENPGFDIYALGKITKYNVKWIAPKSTITMPAETFYVLVAQDAAPASELNVVWTDGSEPDYTTGIENVNVEHEFDGEIFNLQGIRVSAPVKGQIYIQNGKKFMMK